MSPEVIAILSVGATLGIGLGSMMFALWREVTRLAERVARLETRVAYIEGAITGVLSERRRSA